MVVAIRVFHRSRKKSGMTCANLRNSVEKATKLMPELPNRFIDI